MVTDISLCPNAFEIIATFAPLSNKDLAKPLLKAWELMFFKPYILAYLFNRFWMLLCVGEVAMTSPYLVIKIKLFFFPYSYLIITFCFISISNSFFRKSSKGNLICWWFFIMLPSKFSTLLLKSICRSSSWTNVFIRMPVLNMTRTATASLSWMKLPKSSKKESRTLTSRSVAPSFTFDPPWYWLSSKT